MRQVVKAILSAGVIALASSAAQAQEHAPVPITPETVKWAPSPVAKGLEGAWFVGAQNKPGLYAFRVKLVAGGRIPPHTHPDERNSTVLAGTLYVGFGDTFDESRMVAVHAGSMYVAPANKPHYLWAKDGDVTYQEAGVGPTATQPIKR